MGPGHGDAWGWCCHGRFGHADAADAPFGGCGCPRPPGNMPAARGWSPEPDGWVGGAMADPGLFGDGSGPAEAQTGDRGWSRFGSASPDGDSGLIRRNSFEDRPRSTLERTNLTGLQRPCPGGSPNGCRQAVRCLRRLVRAGAAMVLLRCRVAHIRGKPGICSGCIHRFLPTSPGIHSLER